MVVGALAAAFFAPAAWPATASVTTEFGDRFLTYRADPGEANNLTASQSAGTVTITDVGATIVAGAGCKRGDAE